MPYEVWSSFRTKAIATAIQAQVASGQLTQEEGTALMSPILFTVQFLYKIYKILIPGIGPPYINFKTQILYFIPD